MTAAPLTARANRTLAARAAAHAATDALAEIYGALRAADGMPTWEQVDAFERAANALAVIAYRAIEDAEQEQEPMTATAERIAARVLAEHDEEHRAAHRFGSPVAATSAAREIATAAALAGMEAAQ